MPKVVKSISLDERTAPIAQSKSNFSAWVREQLLSEIAYDLPCNFFTKTPLKIGRGGHTTKDYSRSIKEICNGMARPPCVKCYPEGGPEQEDWLEYVSDRITKEELQERAEKKWKWRTDLKKQAKTRKENEKSTSIPPIEGEKRYVRRFLKWVWSYI